MACLGSNMFRHLIDKFNISSTQAYIYKVALCSLLLQRSPLRMNVIALLDVAARGYVDQQKKLLGKWA